MQFGLRAAAIWQPVPGETQRAYRNGAKELNLAAPSGSLPMAVPFRMRGRGKSPTDRLVNQFKHQWRISCITLDNLLGRRKPAPHTHASGQRQRGLRIALAATPSMASKTRESARIVDPTHLGRAQADQVTELRCAIRVS